MGHLDKVWATKTGLWASECGLDNPYVKISARPTGQAFKTQK